MYAPFGTGALIGRRDLFEQGEPEYRGGGTIEFVTLNSVAWAEPPDRDEAGSPNVAGAVALAAAIKALQGIGMDWIARHEAELTAYTLGKLAAVDGIQIFGDPDPATSASRLGVVPLNVRDHSHFLVASILGTEWGIGVRHGCFCAHPYLTHLMGVSETEADHLRADILAHNRRDMPGLVRASFGMYNTTDEVDVLVEALTAIAAGQHLGQYEQDPRSGEYHARGWEPDLAQYFKL
jgi:selenocysteine lyase/cysteine desulfurase